MLSVPTGNVPVYVYLPLVRVTALSKVVVLPPTGVAVRVTVPVGVPPPEFAATAMATVTDVPRVVEVTDGVTVVVVGMSDPPVPVRVSVKGDTATVGDALSVNTSLTVAEVVGVKVAAMLQLLPAASTSPEVQVVEGVKCVVSPLL
jgi:hypothetical protein